MKIGKPCVTLEIQNPDNPGLVRTYLKPNAYSEPSQRFRMDAKLVKYSGMFRTLYNARILKIMPYSELCHLESCVFRHSRIFNNDSYNDINFLFFTLILHTFQRNLERHMFFDYNGVIFSTRLSLFK